MYIFHTDPSLKLNRVHTPSALSSESGIVYCAIEAKQYSVKVCSTNEYKFSVWHEQYYNYRVNQTVVQWKINRKILCYSLQCTNCQNHIKNMITMSNAEINRISNEYCIQTNVF